MKTSMLKARGMVDRWVNQQRELKARNPRHKLVIDVGMESVFTLHPTDLVRQVHGEQALASLDAMRGIEMGRIWEAIKQAQNTPPGGAGGLGIIEETILWTAARFGHMDNFGLVNFSLLHTMRRKQSFSDFRQEIDVVDISPEGSEGYLPLGELAEITFNGKQTPITARLFTGFRHEENFVPAVRLSLAGTTGKPYPDYHTQENFDQMQVLGQGGYNVARELGLLDLENPLADIVIGHDGHSVLFKFNLFLGFLDHFKSKGENPERAHELAELATEQMCRATIHAPQAGTRPVTTGDQVRKHYTEEQEKLYGLFTVSPHNPSEALFGEIALSKKTGVVSPLHLMVTRAEVEAKRRGFHKDAHILLPEDVSAEDLTIFPDTLDVESWLGMGTIQVLDKHCPGWRKIEAKEIGSPEFIDEMRANTEFRINLAKAFEVQEFHLLSLLNDHCEMLFDQKVPGNAIILASLRRGTAYKINLIKEFLERAQVIESIAKGLNRPIYYLFGGLAHQGDTGSIKSLRELLRRIEGINQEHQNLKANFLVGYDFEPAKWIFPGLARRGLWVGATNPIGGGRSEGTEAFGPSYIKAAMNGVNILGTHDGGAACLSYLPTVELYGPATFAGETSFHNDLWGNDAVVNESKALLARGFISSLSRVAGRIDGDLMRFENGRGHMAPGLDGKIIAMFRTIADWNGRVLMREYLS